jgi:3',5'-cyclic AMP phosphodiesterase CpdA
MTRILHLSDLHFGDGHHFVLGDASPGSRPKLADAVTAALQQESIADIDQVVISGDLFDADQSKDLYHATDGIKELVDGLGIDPGRVLCVPGNHDLTWDLDFKTKKFRFYDDAVRSIGAVGLSDEMPHVVIREGDCRPLAFVLLNSCRIETQQLAGLGEVGSEQLNDVVSRLQSAHISADTHTIVAVMHHHLLPIVAHEEKLYDPHGTAHDTVRPSLVIDAVKVLQRLAEIGVPLVLHGHQHHSAILRYEDVLHERAPVAILAAGSCGTSGVNMHRHFSVIEIDDERTNVRSFIEDDTDHDRFITGRRTELVIGGGMPQPVVGEGNTDAHAQGKVMSLPMADKDEYCEADQEGRSVDLAPEPVEQAGEDPDDDNSDLCVLFFSVADCPTARAAVRQALSALPGESFWQKQEPYVLLLGMYDLLGNWDLAVRLRIGDGVKPSRVSKYLDEQLQAANQRQKKGPFSQGPFSKAMLLEVTREANSVRELLTESNEPVKRRILGDTDAYDRLRCQRSLIWIELGADSREVLDWLADAIETAPEVAAIIESASLDDQVLLLETFSACGQSSEIAHLNRLIEPVLANWHRQKYTLTCYGYDETPLIIGERVAA